MSVRLRRFWIQLTSDRRRLGVLCAVVGMAMLLWARLIVVSRMPRMAIADETAALTGPALDVNSATSASASTAPKPLGIVLATRTERDPFVISPRYFPKPTNLTELALTIGKSDQKDAEEPLQVQARITAQLQALVDGMRLEAALSGSMAVIDGRRYRVGDAVEVAASNNAASERVSFLLVEIRQRSIVLECEGRQFEIRMTSP